MDDSTLKQIELAAKKVYQSISKMIAASQSSQKEMMIKVILNLLK